MDKPHMFLCCFPDNALGNPYFDTFDKEAALKAVKDSVCVMIDALAKKTEFPDELCKLSNKEESNIGRRIASLPETRGFEFNIRVMSLLSLLSGINIRIDLKYEPYINEE